MTTAHGAAAAATAASEPLTEFTDDVLHLAGGLELSLGGRLPAVDIAWRMTGPAGAPVVAVLGGISAHRRVSTVSAAERGWWPALVGDGLGVDTECYRVLSFDYLGQTKLGHRFDFLVVDESGNMLLEVNGYETVAIKE